jgi:hypothetical protein
MDYSVLLDQILTKLGIKFQPVYVAYDIGYNVNTGWPLKLPDLDSGSYLLLHFQDFVTVQNNQVLELQKVEERYGSDASRVIVTYWNHGLEKIYTGPINLVEFSNHNYDMAQALAKNWDQWKDILSQSRQGWQCLNGRMCPHRQRAVDVLKDWLPGTLSYGPIITLPIALYANYDCDNIKNFIALKSVYGSAAVNIVTETQYENTPGIVSEKTLMSFAAEQIPIVIGHQGIVQHCKELGFDMFEDLVDTSYDFMPNESRVEMALKLNQDLIQGRINLAPYSERLRANRMYLLDDFVTRMELRLIRDFEKLSALQIS